MPVSSAITILSGFLDLTPPKINFWLSNFPCRKALHFLRNSVSRSLKVHGFCGLGVPVIVKSGPEIKLFNDIVLVGAYSAPF